MGATPLFAIGVDNMASIKMNIFQIPNNLVILMNTSKQPIS